VAPREPFHLLRWQFVPVQNPRDGAVHWKWRGYSQTGSLVMQSEDSFDSLTECMDDAKEHGYGHES